MYANSQIKCGLSARALLMACRFRPSCSPPASQNLLWRLKKYAAARQQPTLNKKIRSFQRCDVISCNTSYKATSSPGAFCVCCPTTLLLNSNLHFSAQYFNSFLGNWCIIDSEHTSAWWWSNAPKFYELAAKGFLDANRSHGVSKQEMLQLSSTHTETGRTKIKFSCIWLI